ncbi:MAG TPA: hypothetical protein VJZ71_07505 [Phycisphaerae bacterium]|nr:hypothetical protein [Phycisphaerae bacterium]
MGYFRRIGILLSVVMSIGGAVIGAASYIHQVRGGYQITIWPLEYGSGKISASIIGGCLSFNRQVRYSGTSSSKDLQISVPGVFEFSDCITDGGFVVLSGRPPLFRAWDISVDLMAVAAIALVYPGLVSRRLRGILKWAFLIASLACFTNLFLNLMPVLGALHGSAQQDTYEKLGRLLLFSVLGSIFYLQALKDTRQRQQACPVCGYDLMGNVSGICPECGRRMSARS